MGLIKPKKSKEEVLLNEVKRLKKRISDLEQKNKRRMK